MSTTATDLDYSSPRVPDGALFVAADEPLLVFPSAKAAERYLEAIDVENGVYPAAYGPNGEPYRIAGTGSEVVIERAAEPKRPAELKALLGLYLQATRHPFHADASLESLVATVWKIESDFWQKRDPYGERFGSRISIWGCLAFLLLFAAGAYLVFH